MFTNSDRFLDKCLLPIVLIFLCQISTAESAPLIWEGTWTGKTSTEKEFTLSVKDGTISVNINTEICNYTVSRVYSDNISPQAFLIGDFGINDSPSFGGEFSSSSDNWNGEYSWTDWDCGIVETGTWEAFRIPSLSYFPESFETLDVDSSLDFPITFSKNAVYLTEHIYVVAENAIHQVDKSGVVINSFSVSEVSSISGFTSDGTSLWISGREGFDNKLYKLDTSGQVIGIYDFSGNFSLEYLAFDGEYIWGIDAFGKLYKVDQTGNSVSNYDLDLTSIKDLIFDGVNLWTNSGKTLIKLNTSGIIIDSYELPDEIKGLAYDGNHLWAIVGFINSELYKMNTHGSTISVYDSPEHSGIILSDEQHLWFIGSDIYKLHEDHATIEVGISKLRTFILINDGATSLEISDISITGVDKSEFSIEANTCFGEINTFDSCSIDVLFQPITKGRKKADLNIFSNDPKLSEVIIPLSGGLVVTTPLNVSQCAVYDPSANPQVTIPCVDVNGTLYSAGLNIVSPQSQSLRFAVDMDTLQVINTIPSTDCAVYPFGSQNSLYLNCVDVGGDKLWAQLNPTHNPAMIEFDLGDYGNR